MIFNPYNPCMQSDLIASKRKVILQKYFINNVIYCIIWSQTILSNGQVALTNSYTANRKLYLLIMRHCLQLYYMQYAAIALKCVVTEL